MSAPIRRLAAWLRSSDRDRVARPDAGGRDVVAWLGELAGDPREQRAAKDAVDRAMQVYQQVLTQLAASSCSCSARRVVVIHDPGTYCGDAQIERLAVVIDSDDVGPDYAPAVAHAVLDALPGGRRG